MKSMVAVASSLLAVLALSACSLMPEKAPEEPVTPPEEPTPRLVMAEQFGPLEYRIDPAHRARWDQVLELQERLFERQGRVVEEDDLHRLYNDADVDDDDVLVEAEIEEAFRQMKREYERYLTRSS